MLTNLFGRVSFPGLSALLIYFAAAPCSCVPVSLFLCKALCCVCLNTCLVDGPELCTAEPTTYQWLFDTHCRERACQSLRTTGRVIETYRVWPLVAFCKMWPMFFLSWDRADIVGNKLMHLCKAGVNAPASPGRSTGKELVQLICHSAHSFCFLSELRGLLGRADSSLVWDPKKAFSFPKSGQRKDSVVLSGAKR